MVTRRTTGLIFRPLGGTEFSRGFSRFTAGVRDWSPVLVGIAANLQKGMAMQFATQGYYGGRGWRPLSAAYAARKAKEYPGAPILVRTGHMRKQALFPQVRITPFTLTMSIHDRKFRFHQLGTRKMPARKMIQIPESQRVEWGRLIHRFLVHAAGNQ